MAIKIVVIAEDRGGEPTRASLEAVGFAAALAQRVGGETATVALGREAVGLARRLADLTGLAAFALEHASSELYNAETWLAALAEIVGRVDPQYLLIPHSAVGWDYAPRLAARLKAAFVSGAVALADADPIAFIRRSHGGRLEHELAPLASRVVVTVTPGAAAPLQARRPGEVVTLPAPTAALARASRRARPLGRTAAPRPALDLARAEVIVTAGRGVGGPERLGPIRELAARFDKGAVGASRPVVDAGWLPSEHQVGQTGQTVAPKLYIACGVSGAIQHVAGMIGSGLIVAINSDPLAPIFQVAHLGAVADLHRLLPALIEKLQSDHPPQAGPGGRSDPC